MVLLLKRKSIQEMIDFSAYNQAFNVYPNVTLSQDCYMQVLFSIFEDTIICKPIE